jgi:Ni,Fe-hydrogenase I cytochrome b subunit
MFFRYPHRHGYEIFNIKGLENIALFHTAGAFLLVAFVVVHLYLITTGRTPTSNLKAMITGYEEIDDEPHPSAPTRHASSTVEPS